MTTPFVDFGRKTQYSINSAMGDTNTMMPVLKERGQKYFPVSDYGECSGWVKQYFSCVKEGIVPILGIEAFVNDYRFEQDADDPGKYSVSRHGFDGEKRGDSSEFSADELDYAQIDFPIDLFARTLDGYYNIIEIHNDAQINGFCKRPRTTSAFLKEHGKGIVAMLPTPYSEIGAHVFNGEKADALRKLRHLRKVFDEVYVEISIVESEDYREINAETIRWCRSNDVSMIPVINAHFDTPEDEEAYPLFMQCVTHRKVFFEIEELPHRYAKTQEEVWDTFKRFHESEVFTEDLMREMMISLDCLCKSFHTLELDTTPKTPHFPNSENELREHARAGLVKRGFDQLPNAQQYRDRLEYELDNICRAGFADYFILIERMFDWHVNQMHRLGSTGRGSAAGSLVLHCLGVTKIDPIKHGLLFERFLDASRLDEIINRGGKLSGADFPDVDCFTMHTLVMSENGPKEIKDVVVGEKMLTRDGTYHAVEKIADYRNAPVVRVVYGDWYFDCTPNHRLLIKRDGRIEYRYVYELVRGDNLVQDESTFIPIEEICNERIVKLVRDLKIEGQHCFRVCGRAYNRVLTKEGQEFFLSDNELKYLEENQTI